MITVNSVAPGYLETEMSAGLEQRQRSQIVEPYAPRAPGNRR